MRQKVAIPCETTLNCPYLVIYYDHVAHLEDGMGWCVEALPGSTTQRYDTYERLMEYLANSSFYRNYIEVELT